MHSAPAVSYPVGRSRAADRLLFVLWAMGAACAGAAVLQLDALGARAALLAASVLLAGGAAWRFGQDAAFGELRFDGQCWSLSGPRALHAARVEVGVDLQFLLLVRLTQPEHPRRWLWLERRANPARWHDLRRAVYSRAPTASLADPPADAAPPTFR